MSYDQIWRENVPKTRPTKHDLQAQVSAGLATASTNYHNGLLTDVQLGMVVRRALGTGLGVVRVAQISGLSITKIHELEGE